MEIRTEKEQVFVCDECGDSHCVNIELGRRGAGFCYHCLSAAISRIDGEKKEQPAHEHLREVLRGYYLPYHQAAAVMELLHDMSKAAYQPKYPDLYLEFMNANECSFSENHPQETNKPYYFTLFTVVSQHVMGDCVEECLDKAIEIAQAKQ